MWIHFLNFILENYFFILFVFFLINIEAQDTETKTYYFIRFAEKDKCDPSNKNLDLTEKGYKEPKNGVMFLKC